MTPLRIKLCGGQHDYVEHVLIVPVDAGGTGKLSARQLNNLDRKFCGKPGCACGGADQAQLSMPPGWQMAGRLMSDAVFLRTT